MAAASGLLASLGWRLAGGGAGAAPLVVAALPIAWLAADAVSGLVHWWADRIASEELPLLGPRFVRPFREHHADPGAIARHDFLETNGNTCLAALPLLAATLWLAPAPASGPGALFASSFVFWLTGATLLTNQIHKWAHAERAPTPVRWLQRAGLVLDGGHHALHHAPPFDRRFCITHGWLNPLLDRCGAFAALERWLQAAAPPAPGDAGGRGP